MYFSIDHPKSNALFTLWTARMLERGFFSVAGIYPMLAHEDRNVDAFLEAAGPVMGELAEAILAGDIEQRIGGPEKRSGVHRLA